MSISKTRDGVAAATLYLSLDVGEALILADLVRSQAKLSEQNSAPNHAALCRRFADGIDGELPRLAGRIGKAVAK